MAADANDPYGFIMNPEKPSRNPLNFGGGNSMLSRLLIVGAGAVLLIIIFAVGISMLSSSSNAQNEKLLAVAQTQKEILRISQTTDGKISNGELNDIVANASISIQSSLGDFTSALAERGKKVKDKDLAGGQNPKNDEVLTQAEQNSQFDKAYKELLLKQLNDYQIQLEAAHGSANDDEKLIIANAYEQSKLLIAQLKAIQ